MTIILLVAILLLLSVVMFFSYKAAQPKEDNRSNELRIYFDHLRSEIQKLDATIKSEISSNRRENNTALQQTREEIGRSVTATLANFNERQKENFSNLTKNQDLQNLAISEKITVMTAALQGGLKTM